MDMRKRQERKWKRENVVSSVGDFIDLIIILAMLEAVDEEKNVVQCWTFSLHLMGKSFFNLFFLLELDFPSDVDVLF